MASLDATAAPLSRCHTLSYRTRSLAAPLRDGTPVDDVGLLDCRAGVGAPPGAGSGVRRGLWPALMPARASLWARLVLHHEVKHAAVRLHRGGRRPSPSIARGRLRWRGPSPWPREDLGVDLLERAVHSVTLSEPASSSSLMVLGALRRPIGARAPRRAVVVVHDSRLTLSLYLERFKGYFRLNLRGYLCLVYMDP